MCTIKQTKKHKYILFYFFNAPWVNFLHQNIVERLAYFGLNFFALVYKVSSFWEFRTSLLPGKSNFDKQPHELPNLQYPRSVPRPLHDDIEM
jgi:hypothetical protein